MMNIYAKFARTFANTKLLLPKVKIAVLLPSDNHLFKKVL